jgi:predicted Zn-dependent protease
MVLDDRMTAGPPWSGILPKWRLAMASGSPDPAFEAARSALLGGRLDEAWQGFSQSASRRQHPHDQVGIGDVLLARGNLPGAAEAYRRAIGLSPDDPLGWLGLLYARVVAGEARAAADDLEVLVASQPDDEVTRYYLASAWHAVIRQTCGEPRDGALVLDQQQAAECEHAARRVLDLRAGDPALDAAAQRLLAEMPAGRGWVWDQGTVAAVLAVAAVALGIAAVVVGGLTGQVFVVAGGAALGALALLGVVLRYRREAWLLPADRVG